MIVHKSKWQFPDLFLVGKTLHDFKISFLLNRTVDGAVTSFSDQGLKSQKTWLF